MAFSQSLAGRIRDALGGKRGIEEKKMFGGIGFLLNGTMLVGVWKNSLIVRLGPGAGEEALLEPHVRVFGGKQSGQVGQVHFFDRACGRDQVFRACREPRENEKMDLSRMARTEITPE